MKRVYLLVLFLLTFSAAVDASTFSFSAYPESLTVSAGSSKKIELNVTSDYDDRFIIHSIGLLPWMTLENIGFVEAGKPKTISLYLSPYYDTPPGIYKLSISLESLKTGEIEEKNIFITVIRDVHARISKIFVFGELQPNGTANIRIDVTNFGTVSLQNLLITYSIYSPRAKILDSAATIDNINPNEIKSVEETVFLGYGVESGTYKIEAEIFYKDRRLGSETQYFEVISTPLIKKDVKSVLTSMGKRVEIKLVNVGNAKAEDFVIVEDIGIFGSKFYCHKLGPKPDIIQGKAKWVIEDISPGEEITIRFEINYSPLIIPVIIIILALFIYVFRIRRVVIKKEIIKPSRKTPEFTVAIEIKNKTGKAVNRVILRDKVPIIFRVKSFTGLKPKIKSSEKHTEFMWKFTRLKPDEEILLSYKLRPIISVEGGVKLSKAEIKYSINEKVFVNTSNSCVVRES